ncbi:cytochrome c3 family protein [Oryzomonas rubra]|uniref:Tetrahaem cytochrome domain-containing protein n=1 Tax=Oryzomonas rubra TaxID=2509454 RepID=A0A5A9X6G5_9BACT|nr:cytochrome c3 family protein [Oryzomonas rubra]KAA0887965.1 hypothetical protein ET418_17880 [Oryzomonas rubra]
MKKTVAVGVIMAMAVLSASISLYAGDKKMSLADKHKSEGVACVSCHGKDVNEIVPNQNCLACHESFEKIAERTKDMPINPHKSAHFIDLECSTCHDGHKDGTVFCQSCHGPITRHK